MKTVLKISILGLFVAALIYMQPRSVYAVDIIYWTDMGSAVDQSTQDGKIYRINTDGTDFQTIVGASGGAYDPADVVVDNRGEYSNWKIYWTDNHGDDSAFIHRADYDGSNVTTILSTGSADIKGLDIDLTAGKLYYSYGADIRSINLNGTGDATLLTSGILDDLNPDPSGQGFLDFSPVLNGLIVAADTNGYAQQLLPTFDFGLTNDHTAFGSDPGDVMTTNSVVATFYDAATDNSIISFSDANDTLFVGTDNTDNALFFSSNLGGTYSLADVSGNTSSTEAYVIANSTSGSDGIYSISGQTLTAVPNTLFSGNFSGMTIVNPELPPGVLGYLAMGLSFMVVWLRSRFHFHH